VVCPLANRCGTGILGGPDDEAEPMTSALSLR
jgi:hypothetical protein